MPEAVKQKARIRDIVLFSLAVTTTCGLIALALYSMTSARFILSFILLRWSVIAVLILAPIIGKLFPSLGMPAVLRTPLTVLVLTCESILVDIIGAQLH